MTRCTIHKSKYVDNFTTVDNGCIRNPNISFKALGVWIYLMHLPTDWKISPKHIASTKGCGKDLVYSALRELEQEGYAKFSQEKNGDGTFGDSYWEVSAYPEFKNKVPRPGFPDTDNPDPVNPPLLNTNPNKEHIETNNKGPAVAGGAVAPIESLPASSVCCENIFYEDMGGNAKSITKSEIYSQFLRKPYPTDVLEEAVNTLINKKISVNDVIKYLEGICKNILEQKKCHRGGGKIKTGLRDYPTQPIPIKQENLVFFTQEQIQGMMNAPYQPRM